jgi:hypothetical protein
MGTNRVYETTNDAENWNPISTPNTAGWTTSSNIDTLAIAASDRNTIYASAGGSTFVTTDDGVTWVKHNITGATDHVAELIVDPTNSQIAYAVRDRFGGGKIFRTVDGGAHWSNITANLPDVPAYSVALGANGPGTADDVIYLGSDTGVYTSADLGATWTQLGSGLPTVQVRDLRLNQNNMLLAGTYGRGAWEMQVGPPVGNVVAAQDGQEVHLSWSSNTAGNFSGFDIERSIDGGAFSTLATPSASASTYIDTAVQAGHSYVYQISAVSGQGSSAAAQSGAVDFQQTGDVSFLGGFAGASGLTLNEAKVNGSRLQLTDGGFSESRSAFLTLGSSVTQNFSTQFDFQFTNPGADGFTFTLQSNTPRTGGRSGGAMGYGNIPNSVGVFFNMYSNVSQTGLFTGGSTTATRKTIANNPFHVTDTNGSTHIFHVTLHYDAASKTLSETLVDTGNNATFSTSYSIDMAAVLNDQNAYAGFTAGTGGLAATQDILNWWWSPTGAAPSTLINGTSGADNLVLTLDADHQHIDVTNNGVSQAPVLIVANGKLFIHGNGGSDIVTIDESNGEVLAAGASTNVLDSLAGSNVVLNFIGSAGADSVTLDGTAAKKVVFNGSTLNVSTANLTGLGYTSTGGSDALTVLGSVPVALNANVGTVTVAAGGGVAAAAPSTTRQVNFSSVNIGSGAKVAFAKAAAHANHTVAAIDALTIAKTGAAFTGTLDLGDNVLILRNAGATGAAGILSMLSSGLAGGAWNGTGLASSAAATDPNAATALGWLPNTDAGFSQFEGVNVGATDVMVKYTYYGDADLNGMVDSDDVNLTTGGYGTTSGATWDSGDFDYSGGVNSDDANLLTSNYGAGWKAGNPNPKL